MRLLGVAVLAVGCGVLAGKSAPGQNKDAVSGSKIVDFARKNVGKQVGDGECATLVAEAFKEAGAKPHGSYKDSPNEGDYVWGELVYGLEITRSLRTESTPIGTFVKPGDVIQYRDAKFAGKSPSGTYKSEAPHHTAVVTS